MPTSDPRLLANGRPIPAGTYADQPYIVPTADGAWLCCLTTGRGHEGDPGQGVVTRRSTDHGQSWSDPVWPEPPESPENSYAVLLRTPGGRIYIFYSYNADNVREVKCHDPALGAFKRVDSLGQFVFKYSDDHGRSWSAARYPIPVRAFACDRDNVYGGALRFFWNVSRPFTHAGAAFVGLHKVGRMGRGFFAQSEGALLKSDNLLTEPEPARIRWETLPDGDTGLRSPPGGGPIAEEQSYSVLSDGSLFAVYRTIAGWPACSYSRDGGHTWSEPQWLTDANGRRFKHPRAANFAWKCANGRFLYWFHNHGGRFLGEREDALDIAYNDRNPAWLCGGVEADSPAGKIIRWGQPEIVLYDDDPLVRMSYPDLVEENGRYWLTETQKSLARVHEIPAALLATLWSLHPDHPEPAWQWRAGQTAPPLPDLPALVEPDATRPDAGAHPTRAGWTLILELAPGAAGPLWDTRDAQGKGVGLERGADGVFTLALNDGRQEARWASSPNAATRLAVIVDGGPHLILFVLDGVLDDGGDHRQFGWGRFSPTLRDANGAREPGRPPAPPRLAPGVTGAALHLRALRVNETNTL